jgi:hypothetical protein
MPSTITTIFPVRIEHELIARIEALALRVHGSTRTAVARDALRRGVELLEAELDGSGVPKKPGRSRKKAAAPPGAAAAEAKPAEDLAAFAAQVLDAARRSPSGWFGDDRVFISHVWRQYKRKHGRAGLALELFKVKLVEANRQRLLSLARADMAPQLDQKDVKASETNYLSATFHFVCVEPSPRTTPQPHAQGVRNRARPAGRRG